MTRGRTLPLIGALLAALLLLAAAVAQAQTVGPSIVLTWTYEQDPVNPASKFVIQRCIQAPTSCAMLDLAGATAVPLASLTYTDVQIVTGVQYCFQVAAANTFGRGKYSSTVCAIVGSPPGTTPQNLSLRLTLPTP